MVSLVGCIIPRTRQYVRLLRARPPRAPTNFGRLPESRIYHTAESPQLVLQDARRVLGRRVRADVILGEHSGEVRAQRGYLREAGNLIFHISVIVVLVGVAVGSLVGYRGAAIVVEDGGFANTLTQYDEFSAGPLFDRNNLPPFTLSLDDMQAAFQMTGPQRGAPRKFEAVGSYTSETNATPKPFDITVNHPLKIGQTSVFLVGQGYAPVVKVTGGDGKVAFNGAVPFLPQDGSYTSMGVIKAPDAKPSQLGFQGFFLPTAVSVDGKKPVSVFPAAANPIVGLFAYYGDLGLDTGTPQSVYTLTKDKLTQIQASNGGPLRLTLAPGDVARLPNGKGTVQFVGVRQFARFQIASSPGAQIPLWGISIGVLGLIASLTIRPRRTWVRAHRAGEHTVVEVAALERGSHGDLATVIDSFIQNLQILHPPCDPAPATSQRSKKDET